MGTYDHKGWLKARVRDGSFSFSTFVEYMKGRGYVTETDAPDGTSIVSSCMERFCQEEFDELYAFFYPGYINNFKIRCVATNEGAMSRGSYSYALYNEAVISRVAVEKVLKRESENSRDFE